MATASTSTAVTAVESVFTEPERLALAGFLVGYTGLTREAYALDLRQFTSACSRRAAPTSSASPATWRPAAAPGPPSPGGCAPSPGSTSTPSRKNCLITLWPRMSAVPGSITSRTLPGWTVTSSARCWSPPVLAWPVNTR
jgi:hypothetical protein